MHCAAFYSIITQRQIVLFWAIEFTHQSVHQYGLWTVPHKFNLRPNWTLKLTISYSFIFNWWIDHSFNNQIIRPLVGHIIILILLDILDDDYNNKIDNNLFGIEQKDEYASRKWQFECWWRKWAIHKRFIWDSRFGRHSPLGQCALLHLHCH